MQRTWKRGTIGMAALCCSLGLLMTGLSYAQQSEAEQRQLQQRQAQQQQLQQRQAQGQAGEKEFCLATELIGMTAKAKGEEEVGQIRNLVINKEGEVQFVALSASSEKEAATPRSRILQPDRPDAAQQQQPGQERPDAAQQQQPGQERQAATAGKLTLVPWEMVKLHTGATSAQSYVSIEIDKERLTSAPSFTEQQLTAQQSQAQVTAQVNQFFNVRQRRGAARPELNREEDQSPRGTQPQPNDN